ncbi:ABC transporter substrate binding protein [Marinifilum sp.]|uniref:sensor histidine kinase n=1 Tax=Marinifilum sp. TaxID=2033137 RepID=UPI003BACEAF8
MRISIKLFLFTILVLYGFIGFSSSHKHILILNSYHNGLSWTDSILNSIKRELLPDPNCTLYIEYMDTKRYFSDEYLDLLKVYYREKYKSQKLDLIISTDNNAYEFLSANRNEVFGEVPVIFSGVNDINAPPKGYSGVFENFSFCQTLKLIENHHPNYSKIVVVTDYSRTGESLLSALEKEISEMDKAVKYVTIRPKSLKDLKISYSNLAPNDVVLYLLYNRDFNGNYCTYEKGFTEAIPYCKVPVYCVWDFYLNRGAIGGSLITGRIHGKQVAKLAKKVLSGIPVDSIPPLLSEYEYGFDYNQLVKFDINIKDLPKNSKLLNEPYSLVKENKEIAILTLTILVLLSLVIIVMTINIHLRKLKEQKEKTHLLEITTTNVKLEKAIKIAEESSRLKSAFLANMSHEIRTPMNAILGFTELLSADNVEDAKRKKFISIIKKNTNALLRLINDILDISKIETDQLKVSMSKCNMSELFDSIKENYEAIAEYSENNKLTFIVSLPQEEQVTEITTDSVRLQQIFSNLLENSIKFTQEGEIEIGYQLKGKHIEFFVRDTGIGIPDDKQEIIFDRFRQAEMDSHTRQYGGTGLGLAICRSLIELLGGEIRMKSKPHAGTTFYFTIPLLNYEL